MADLIEDKDQDSTEKEDLWSSILNDVSVSGARSRSTSAKNVLVLGDVCSGKSTLIDRLCQVTAVGKSRRSQGNQGKFLLSGCSLEYRFIDVYDNDTDDFLARMGIWNLDGVVWHSQLLPFVLREKNVDDTIVMIVIDLSLPWNALDSLERWTQVLNKHINSLKISEKKRRQMEENIVKFFQSYQDPEEQSSGGVLSGEGDEVVLPLDENILSCNLGVPLVVVCTKSDHFSQLERNHSYRDEHFDFIQQHVRRFCLNYGAALVYTSTKENKNISLLRDYLIHRTYRLRFTTPASVLEREAVFIPSGWDNDKRIAVVCDQMKHINPREPLRNIIIPPRATVPLSDTEGVSAEDDQALLLALQAYLLKAPKSSSSDPLPSGSQRDKSPRPSVTPGESDSVMTKPLPTNLGGGGGGGGGEQVLAAFFTGLLNKNKPVSRSGRNAAALELDKQLGKGGSLADNK